MSDWEGNSAARNPMPSPAPVFSNLSWTTFIDSLLVLWISVALSAWFFDSTFLSDPPGPGYKLIYMSMVFVHAPEVVSLLASILFPYRLSFSPLPPILSPSSKFASFVIYFHTMLFSSHDYLKECFFTFLLFFPLLWSWFMQRHISNEQML